MNIFTRFWNWLISLFWRKEISITLIGPVGAGKTTLVRALSNQSTDNTIPTIGAQPSEVRVGNVQFKMCDIGGHKQYQYLWSLYFKSSDVVLYVIDGTDSETSKNATKDLETIFNDDELSKVPMVLIVNKYDLPGCMTKEDVTSMYKVTQYDEKNIPIFVLSAKTKANLSDLVQYLTDNF